MLFAGRLPFYDSGQITIVKHYINQHDVLYLGTSDGEGTFAGHWEVSEDRGDWLISLGRSKDRSNDAIQELLP